MGFVMKVLFFVSVLMITNCSTPTPSSWRSDAREMWADVHNDVSGFSLYHCRVNQEGEPECTRAKIIGDEGISDTNPRVRLPKRSITP